MLILHHTKIHTKIIIDRKGKELWSFPVSVHWMQKFLTCNFLCMIFATVNYFDTGDGGGELNQREGQRVNNSQSWVENTNMTDFFSSLETLINTCRKVPNHVNFFRWRHLVLVFLQLINSYIRPSAAAVCSSERLLSYSTVIFLSLYSICQAPLRLKIKLKSAIC